MPPRTVVRTIVGAAALLAGQVSVGAAPDQAARHCPPPEAPLVERFIPADCSACWAQGAETAPRGPASPGRRAWRLDWITPAGDDAAMAVPALPEAAERQARAPRAAAPGDPAASASRRGRGGHLAVQTGPAWSGYIGASVSLRPGGQALPAGSSAWLALVEWVPAGSEGNAAERQLVRALAGPLALPLPGQAPLEHLRALRWPDNARPERLTARAWIEGPDGRVLRMAADRCPPG